MRRGELLWEPSPAAVEAARLIDYARFLERTRGLRFQGYADLWDWSVRELEPFPLERANDALAKLRAGAVRGALALVP